MKRPQPGHPEGKRQYSHAEMEVIGHPRVLVNHKARHGVGRRRDAGRAEHFDERVDGAIKEGRHATILLMEGLSRLATFDPRPAVVC
jgi:hypothetical protein